MKPVNPVQNPLREMRLRLGYPLDRVAADLGTTRQFVIRAEQAVYANPPPALTEYLLNRTEPLLDKDTGSAAVGGFDDIGTVYHLYSTFQTATRKAHYGKLAPSHDFSKPPSGEHPFIMWRMRSGVSARIRISKYFCVHPALIFKFESQPHLCSTPPGELLIALKESGYSSELLASLGNAYDTYKRNMSSAFRDKQL